MKRIIFVLIFISFNIMADYQEGIVFYEKQQYNKAYDSWLPLAEKGNAMAQYSIGIMHELGLGVPKDINKAFGWYKLSASSGYDEVQYALGNAYYFGIEVEKNYQQAIYWWRQAANQGFSDAQYNLGAALICNNKSYHDYNNGKKWLKKAAKQDNLLAKKLLVRLQKKSTKVVALKNSTKPKINTVLKSIKFKKTTKIVQKKKNNTPPNRQYKKLQHTNKNLNHKLTKDTDWISKQPKQYYTLQLTVLPSKKYAIQFIKRHKLSNKAHFYRVNSFYKVIFGIYKTQKQANRALNKLPASIRQDHPWAKSFKYIRIERGF